MSAISIFLCHQVTQLGQFLDHDITLTPEEEADDCCQHPEVTEMSRITSQNKMFLRRRAVSQLLCLTTMPSTPRSPSLKRAQSSAGAPEKFFIAQCSRAVNQDAPVVKISHVFQAVATGAYCLKLEFENHKKQYFSWLLRSEHVKTNNFGNLMTKLTI